MVRPPPAFRKSAAAINNNVKYESQRGAYTPSQANCWLAKASLCSHSLFKVAVHLWGVLRHKLGVKSVVSAYPSTPSKEDLKSKQVFKGRGRDQPTHPQNSNLQQTHRLAI